MNDRFKFRAKLKNIDNWIYGAYLKMLPYQPNPVGHRKPLETEYKHLIITEGSADWGMPREIAAYEVISETVGQCTGLKDKNGKLIYEGDIVRFQYGNGYRIGAVEVDKCDWRISNSNFCQGAWCGGALICLYETCEIIGNIYENKELLG